MTKSGWKEPREDDRDPEGEGFLRRWVQRKVEARDGAPDPAEPSPAPDSADAVSAEFSESVRAREVQIPVETQPREPPERSDDDMPALDSLDQDSDYSPFLSRGVSPALRQTALRQLFRQPKFNVETCLDDFQDDFLNFQPLGDIVTADMRHMAEVEAQREAARVARMAENTPSSKPVQIMEQRTSEDSDRSSASDHAGGDVVGETDSSDAVDAEPPGPTANVNPSDDQTRMKS